MRISLAWRSGTTRRPLRRLFWLHCCSSLVERDPSLTRTTQNAEAGRKKRGIAWDRARQQSFFEERHELVGAASPFSLSLLSLSLKAATLASVGIGLLVAFQERLVSVWMT